MQTYPRTKGLGMGAPNPSAGVLRGERMRDLAQIEGITLKKLASLTGVSQGQMSKIANSAVPLPPHVVDAAMDVFGLPASFFSVIPVQQDLVAATFRKRSTSTAVADKRVAALLTEASRLWREASRRSGYRTANLPDPADYDGDIESTAAALRRLDDLDDEAPVGNVIRLAERHGIAVIRGLDPNPRDEDDHSGVSRPSQNEARPLVATVTDQPGAVARLTIAHELGHVIFDKDLATQPRSRSNEEKRAFAFAGALLLPESMMRRRVSESLTLHAYLRIKADYGVSVGAIIKRAETLRIISHTRARSLHIQLSSQGWRKNEPVPVPNERPLLLEQAVHRVWPVNTARAAAQDIGAPWRLIKTWANTDDGQHDKAATTSNANVIDLASRWR